MRSVTWARIAAVLFFVIAPLSRVLFAQSGSSTADSSASAPAIATPDSSAASAFSSASSSAQAPLPPTIQSAPDPNPPTAPVSMPDPPPPPPRRAPGVVWLPLLFAAAMFGGVAWVELKPEKRRRGAGELA